MWFKLILEAIICTSALFIAHYLPLNSKVIEPAMSRKEGWSYPAGFVYYTAAIAIAVFASHRVISLIQ